MMTMMNLRPISPTLVQRLNEELQLPSKSFASSGVIMATWYLILKIELGPPKSSFFRLHGKRIWVGRSDRNFILFLIFIFSRLSRRTESILTCFDGLSNTFPTLVILIRVTSLLLFRCLKFQPLRLLSTLSIFRQKRHSLRLLHH